MTQPADTRNPREWNALQRSLAESEERLRLIADTIDEVFWMADTAIAEIFYISPAYERIWQRPVAGLYANPRSFLDAIHPDDLGAVLANLARQNQGLPFDHEYRIVRPDGSVRWIWDRGFPVAEAGGAVRRYAGLAQDITERKQAGEEILRLNAELEARVARRTAELEAKTRELRESEERLRLAVEVSQEGLWDWNVKTGRVYFSPVLAGQLDCAAALAGQDPARMWQGLLHPDEREEVAAAVERDLRERGHFEAELRLKAKDGAYRWMLSRGRVVERDEAGGPARVIGTHINIDERRRAEALNRKLAAIVEASSDLIATATPDGRVDYINQAGRALFGLGATESLEHFHIETNHSPEALRRIMEEGIPTALAKGRWLGDNSIRRLDDGTDIPISQLILVLRNQQTGQVESLTTTCRDISDRKRAEDALRQLQQEQELILDTAPAMIWYKDTHNRILRVNAAAAKSLGLRKDQIEGRHIADFFPEEAERYHQDDLAVARTGRPLLGVEEPYQPPTGEKRWIQTDKVPLLDEAGRVSRILVMSVDITERKKVEEALREADRQKDEFLAILAHELRNPLAPISNSLQIMRRTPGKPEAMDRALALMEGQVRDMVRLIDDLLDLSRISRGKIELRKEAANLADIVRHAVETCQPLMAQAGHDFHLDMGTEAIMVEADPARLAQAFANLLNNACKFTPPGGRISLAVQAQGREAVVRVRDDGMGIPAGMLGRIFDMFSQVDRSLEKQHGGLGIGLNVVKRLVELHGGSVEASSEGPGKGSEFTVRLAMLETAGTEEAPSPAPEETAPAHLPRKVLVVDDNAAVAASNAWLLEIMGHEVRIARNGEEAIAMAAELRPDLILLDIGMPGMSGYEACRRIRAEPWGRQMAVVALTGWGQHQDKKMSQEAGFDQHLVKPFDPDELERLLDALPRKT